eukprot:FR738149.1.p1 GENE.FR738149.1~~FR738149.1.p1  ORF type:complete len:136 (+),score=21.16 FR738149.1:3-410(+)
MTNGVTVVLGKTGRNIGAAMTGGLAYLYDDGQYANEEMAFDAMKRRLNPGTVRPKRLTSATGQASLKGLIEEHHEATTSQRAKALLDDWDTTLARFWQIIPASEEKNPNVDDSPAEADAQPAQSVQAKSLNITKV